MTAFNKSEFIKWLESEAYKEIGEVAWEKTDEAGVHTIIEDTLELYLDDKRFYHDMTTSDKAAKEMLKAYYKHHYCGC